MGGDEYGIVVTNATQNPSRMKENAQIYVTDGQNTHTVSMFPSVYCKTLAVSWCQNNNVMYRCHAGRRKVLKTLFSRIELDGSQETPDLFSFKLNIFEKLCH